MRLEPWRMSVNIQRRCGDHPRFTRYASGVRCRARGSLPAAMLGEHARAAFGRPVAQVVVLAGPGEAFAGRLELSQPLRALPFVRIARVLRDIVDLAARMAECSEWMSGDIKQCAHDHLSGAIGSPARDAHE